MSDRREPDSAPADERAEAMAVTVASSLVEGAGGVRGADVRAGAELAGEMAGFILRRMREEVSRASGGYPGGEGVGG